MDKEENSREIWITIVSLASLTYILQIFTRLVEKRNIQNKNKYLDKLLIMQTSVTAFKHSLQNTHSVSVTLKLMLSKLLVTQVLL